MCESFHLRMKPLVGSTLTVTFSADKPIEYTQDNPMKIDPVKLCVSNPDLQKNIRHEKMLKEVDKKIKRKNKKKRKGSKVVKVEIPEEYPIDIEEPKYL